MEFEKEMAKMRGWKGWVEYRVGVSCVEGGGGAGGGRVEGEGRGAE